jgi:hypothetical protein
MPRIKKALAAVSASALLTVSAAGPAAAATQTQDGLVNVAVGDVTIARDVNVAVVADVVAQVCGTNVGPVQLLASQVDATGTATAVCTAGDQVVRITQNA